VISISSDSSKDSMGIPAGRVILFGTIPTTIPDTTPLIAPPTTDTPIIAPIIPPSPNYTPASPDYSPASETESDPSEDPSSGHIPPLPAVSPFVSSDDDTTDNSSSRHSSSDYSSLDLQSTSAGPSRKRRRSPMTSVPALPLVSGALSPVRVDLIPPPKRVKDIGYLADVEDDPRDTRVKRRLRGTASVENQRVDRLQRGIASMTHEEVEELIARRVAKEIEARKVARNLEALNENEEEQEGENGGNENGG
nr:hypothetical protein [Tanacetum cinerariifolium]